MDAIACRPFTPVARRAILGVMDVLTHCLTSPLSSGGPSDLDAALTRLSDCPFAESLARAAWAGLASDRLGFAFVSGYQAALARLVGATDAGRPWPARLCLAATEAGGARPRDIETRVTIDDHGATVRGEKSFATLASKCSEMLVFSWTGERAPDGTKRLRLVRVPRAAPGLRVVDRAPTPFAPEVPHAMVTFDDVRVDARDVLPGDGYAAYVKPFRTIEDIHVLGATVGFLLRVARASGFDPRVIEDLAATLVTLGAVADMAPSEPVTHLALAGLFRAFEAALALVDVEMAKAPAETRAAWERDKVLLQIASKARELRALAARRQVLEPASAT